MTKSTFLQHRAVISLCLLFISFNYNLFSQNSIWNKTDALTKSIFINTNKSTSIYELNSFTFLNNLSVVSRNKDLEVEFPVNSMGKFEIFKLQETQVMHPLLAKKVVSLKTYKGYCHKTNQHVSFSFSEKNGITGLISGDNKTISIQPLDNRKHSFIETLDKLKPQSLFECETNDKIKQSIIKRVFSTSRNVDDGNLRRYRLALSVNGEYSQFFLNGTEVNDEERMIKVLTAMVNSVNRLNQIFEQDLGVTLQLIPNTDQLIFLNPNTDPYQNDFNNEIQNLLTSTIGESNYDVGHVFLKSSSIFGNAGCIACVCTDESKGSAYTAHTDPSSDNMNLIAAHEFGHQFGAYHTQSSSNCRSAINTSEVEPGSGSTIMSYAGICPPNIQLNPDDYFNYTSIRDIAIWTINNSNCAELINTNNKAPIVNAGSNYIIPISTAFVLDVEATDVDSSDTLTYCWEQNDPENPNNSSVPISTRQMGPMFRSLPPKNDTKRYFPNLDDVVNNNLSSTWEVLPSISRELNFVLTVRDNGINGGQTVSDNTIINVVENAGPFLVTSQSSSSEVWTVGDFVKITWDVANTNIEPINVNNVEIYLSTNGGLSFPTLIKSTENDGEETFLLPSNIEATTGARILVKGVNNIFFAVNNQNFTIEKSEYVLDSEETELNVCNSEILTFNAEYKTLLVFEEEVNLSVANLPLGVNAVLNQENFAGSHISGSTFSITLTGISNLAVGKYQFIVEGNSTSEIKKRLELTFNVYSSDQPLLSLISPVNNSISQDLEVVLEWEENSNSDRYFIEIATNNIFSANVIGQEIINSNYSLMGLINNQKYFWRVQSINSCGISSFSDIFEFTTKCSIPTNLINTNTERDSISLSWDDTLSNSSWTVEYGISGFIIGTGNIFNVNEKYFTATLLESGTLYDFYLKGNCSDESSSSIVGPLTIATESNYCNGDHFYDTGGEFLNYENNETITTLITPNTPNQIVEVSFDSFDLESGFDFLRIYDGIDNTSPLIGVYTDKELVNRKFTSTHSSGALTFVFISDSSVTRSGWDATVFCKDKPNCLPPVNFDNTFLSSVEANFEWISLGAENNWNIEYGNAGFTLGNGTTIVIDQPSVNIAGLNPLTTYDIYIKTICDIGGFSESIGPLTFTTTELCSSPSNVEFFEIRKNSTIVNWQILNNDIINWELEYDLSGFVLGSGNKLNTSKTSAQITGLISGTSYDIYLRSNCETDGFSRWNGPFEFNTSFDYCNGDHFYDSGGEFGDYSNGENTITTIYPDSNEERVSVYFNSFFLDGCCDSLSIYDGPNINSPFIGEYRENPGLLSSTHESGSLTFLFQSDRVATFNGWDATVTCESKPNCVSPINFSSTNILSKQVDLGWRNIASDVDSWTIEYGIAGFLQGTGIEVITASTDSSITGLIPNTFYDAYLKSNCNIGGFSEVVGPISFQTTESCLIPTNFSLSSTTQELALLTWDNSIAVTEWEIEYNDLPFSPGTGIGNKQIVETNSITLENLNSNTRYYAFIRANCGIEDGYSNWSSLLLFNTEANYCNGDHFYDTGGEFGNYTNNENYTTIITPESTNDRVRIIFESLSLESCCDRLTVYDGPDEGFPLLGVFTSLPLEPLISTHESGALTFNFRSDFSFTSSGWDAFVICEPKPNCTAPINLSVNNVLGKTAELEWNQIDSGTNSWTIEYGATGFVLGTGTVITSATTNKTISSLVPETIYEVYLKSNCNIGGFSEVVGPISFQTTESCLVPTNFSFSSTTSESALLTWDNSTAVTEWEIEYNDLPFSPGTGIGNKQIVEANSITLENLNSNTRYYAFIRADCGIEDGYSDWSSLLLFNTEADYCNGDHFYDTGGEFGNYSINENNTVVIRPNGSDQIVKVFFNSFDLELGYDFLAIYDGEDDTGNLLGSFSGSELINTEFISSHTSGALIFVFTSDSIVVGEGWDATVTCEPKPNCAAPTNFENTNVSGTTANFRWTQIDVENGVTLEYGLEGFVLGEGITTVTSSNSIEIIDLLAATVYDIYLTNNCTIGGNSSVVGPISFKTNCNLVSENNNLIVNGSFECDDISNWIISGESSSGNCAVNFVIQENTLGICGSISGEITPSNGNYAAFTSFDGKSNTNYTISQGFRVPSNIEELSSITLSYDFKVIYRIPATPTLPLERVFTAKIISASGENLISEIKFGFSTDNSSRIETRESIDVLPLLTSLEGQEVTLQFNAYIPESFTGPSIALIDNVSLIVVSESITTEPTLSIPDLVDSGTINTENSFIIYPNPNKGLFFVDNKNAVNVNRMEVYSIEGRLIEVLLVNSYLKTIEANISNLASGIYFIKLYTNIGVTTHRMIIQK